MLIFVERSDFPSEAKGFSHPKILDSDYASRSHPARISIRQLPPDAGVGADAPMAAFDFLCAFLCDVVPEGAIVFAPDAPDTVSVEPPAFGLLMPVPPCPPAAPPPPAPCA
ncbi:hypothetical protein PPGU19_099610 (plasmid) [Paraburkholderia sp. PGU19]|nr:hypothetical protein PPGU19_099610 [Paraburkholderia sp. PGU19]